MGGYQVSGQGPADDGYDEEGYDESQRAEILEATRDGPSDGNILTDLIPDLGDEDEDALEMSDDELGEEDGDAELSPRSQSEDEIQADLDDDSVDGDELDDADEDSLEP
jgi:hypothetical protein